MIGNVQARILATFEFIMAKVYLTRAPHGEADGLSKRRQFTVQSLFQNSPVIEVLAGLYILLINPWIQIVRKVHIGEVNRVAITALAQ